MERRDEGPPLTFAEICAGIGGARVAWGPLGWERRWVSEIDPFCCAVIDYHDPGTVNLGDMREIRKAEPVDLLIAGTPCQSFSVAGARAGLDDPRGLLAFEFLAIACRLRPRWVVFENVAGLLSSNRGRDFGSFLGALGRCGYGFAYRVLDAQGFGVPQRRRHPYVVGYLGDWRPAAAVLFERASLSGNPTPSCKAGEEVAGSLSARTSAGGGLGTDFERRGGVVAFSLNAKGGSGRMDGESETFVPIADSPTPAYGRNWNGNAAAHTGPLFARQGRAVRRLTPRECERLQGFPDDWTLIPWRGKPREQCPDGPRYRALGNAFPVPVIRWIGHRISAVEQVMR
jgi:DNA (cytosine-5)-methyltransferase 1